MVDRRSRDDPGSAPLRVGLVELVPSDLGTILVRLVGTWQGPRRGHPKVVLIVRARAGEQRFEPLAETSQAAARAAGGEDAFRATFSVPEDLRQALGGGLALEVGGQEVRLPYPEVGGEDEDPDSEPGTVIDRAVLAERRARRAELAEETNARRATEAERAIAGMEAELAKLELRLERAVIEREEIEAALSERDRRARSAGQEAHAEHRLREEAVGEAADRAHAAEAEASQLRTALARADDRAATLADEVESLRRRAAEAQNEAATATATRRRIERTATEVTQRMASVAAAEAEVAAARDELGHAVATANVVRVALGTMRDELGLAAEWQAPRRGEPAAPRQTRPGAAVASDLLEGERRAGAAAAIGPREIERLRADAHRRSAALVQAEQRITETRSTVAEVQRRLEAERLERDIAERSLHERVERELADEQQRGEQVRGAALALQQELSAREQANQRLGTTLSELESEATTLRAENAQHGARRAAADQLVAALMTASDELREQIAAIQREQRLAEARAAETQAAVAERERELQRCRAAEAALRAQLGCARGDLESARVEVEGAHGRLRDAYDRIETTERELEQRVLLQARAQQVVEELRTQLEHLRVEADERSQRETATEGLVNEFMATAGEALEEAEQRIEEARTSAGEIQRQLESERDERDAMERELRDVLARERMEGERRIASLADELRAKLSGGVRELEHNLDTERRAREDAEQRLSSATAVATRELERVRAAAKAEVETAESVAQARVEAERSLARSDLVTARHAAAAELESARREAEAHAQAASEWERAYAGLERELAHLRRRRGETPRTLVPEADAAAQAVAETEARAPRSVRGFAPHSPAPFTAARGSAPWLPGALRLMVGADASATARLLVHLLPAQALAIAEPLDYDLELAELGMFAVTIDERRGRVARLAEPRPADRIAFRLRARAEGLIELLVAGGSRGLLRSGAVELEGRRRKARAISLLQPAPLGLAALARAGVWPDPRLVFTALAGLIDPEWTRGHRFCVGHEVAGPQGGRFYVYAEDGGPIRVTAAPPDGEPDAFIRMAQATFQQLLGGDAARVDHKPRVRGSAEVVAVLTGWTDRAQGLFALPA